MQPSASLQLQGSIVAIATPFRDGKVDEAAFRRLVEFQIENGTSGIVPCGTTGESATLSHEEHEQLVRLTVEIVAGRVPVIAGTGSNSTREALRLTESARADGADAALLITPYYNKPTQEGLYRHYRKIAETVDLPLIVYNCPGRTGVSIAPETVARLAPLKNIVAVKDATASLDWTSEVCGACDLTVLSGDDSATLAQIAVGARGVISVLANVAPGPMAELVAHALADRWDQARTLHHRYFRLMKTLFIETSPIPVKAALEMMGLIGPELRAPLCEISEASRAKLREAMRQVGLL
ncbi:MAG TPA: 4-hydroxy-tetrahydrodipicolinate synthase [Candidatus Sumerlaeota bacterium]|nr:4-hydroxy-tetrahydrodipicolinate synthase [Candidatus Sumerlaeota bacterium]